MSPQTVIKKYPAFCQTFLLIIPFNKLLQLVYKSFSNTFVLRVFKVTPICLKQFIDKS
jgi:hypothetical protein